MASKGRPIKIWTNVVKRDFERKDRPAIYRFRLMTLIIFKNDIGLGVVEIFCPCRQWFKLMEQATSLMVRRKKNGNTVNFNPDL